MSPLRLAGATPRRLALLAVAVLLPAGFLLARPAAERHVAYYTGAPPRSLGCASCHVTGTGGGLRDRLFPPRYRTPQELAVSPDGRRLYVTARDGDALLVVDLAAGRVAREVAVGRQPNGLALAADGATAYVANEGSGTVSRVNLESLAVEAEVPAGVRPTGVALVPDGRLFVTNWASHDVSLFDLSGKESRRLTAGSHPNRMALSGDGACLLVTNETSFPVTSGEPPRAEVTVIDAAQGRVARRVAVADSHLLEGAAFVPGTHWAVVSLIRPKNLLPILQVAHGWTLDNALAWIDLRSGRVVPFLLDDVDGGYADPYGVVVTPDGRRAFVSHSGADVVTALDVPALIEGLESSSPAETASLAHDPESTARFVAARIPTGANPRGLALSPDGRRLYVAERLADRIRVIDTEALETLDVLSLNGTTHETAVRRGERLFNSAAATFQRQFSCRSCHPNQHVDRLQWDFQPDGLGRNLVDNRTLVGLAGTAPFKWNGKNTSLFMQCGMRFARILTRQEPYAPDDLGALVAYIQSLKPWPNPHRGGDGALSPAQERGKRIFERDRTKKGEPIPERSRCITCHPPPLFTDRGSADVGSRSESDDAGELDTPQLINLYDSAPYLHDGRARSLEEIWTRFNPYDTHGVTGDMSKADLNDLIEYLRTL